MKTHIFIATTQGLVAIQNITTIDDEDISSVVSVNGTSTTANISSSYHNFVKKGVGIIHQMFGACSYRVDISARIDQGNSWQVAMYLAHLAQSKNELGNGEVKQGDKVICATGEVNTINQQVLAVGEVTVKLKLAQPQIEKWQSLDIDVQFLLPHANRSDVTENCFIKLVSNLEQAATALPVTIKSTDATNKKSVSINYQHITFITVAILAIGIWWGFGHFNSNDNSQHQTLNKTANMPETKPDTQARLVAQVKQNKTCVQATTLNLELGLTTKKFANLPLNKACELHFRTDKSQLQVLLIAQDAYTVFPLKKSPQGWQVPLPKNRLSSRSYFLVSLAKKLTVEKVEQLRVHREAMPKPIQSTGSALTNWLKNQNVEFTIFSHKLVVDEPVKT